LTFLACNPQEVPGAIRGHRKSHTACLATKKSTGLKTRATAALQFVGAVEGLVTYFIGIVIGKIFGAGI
jgi:hypothetical protein